MHPPMATKFTLSGPKTAPLVVLIHGLGLTRALWDLTVPALSQTHRVLTYDLLGHGQTPHPGGVPTLSDLSDQLAGLMDHTGVQQAAIIGFSLGGMVARRFAQDHPNRTLALGILHSPHRRSSQAQAAVTARVAQAQISGPAATVNDALARWFTEGFHRDNPDMMDLVRGWVLANDPATYPLYYAIFANSVDEVVAPTPPLTCPAFVITADQDFGNSPQMAQAIAAEIPGAQVHILPGLRHMALMEDPGQTNQLVRAFLAQHLPPVTM